AGGHPVPCPCFGPPPAGARPVSAATVARNGALGALAVLGSGSTAGAPAGATALAAAVTVSATLAALRRFGLRLPAADTLAPCPTSPLPTPSPASSSSPPTSTATTAVAS